MRVLVRVGAVALAVVLGLGACGKLPRSRAASMVAAQQP